MSHSDELLDMIEAYGQAKFKAGELYATLQHHVKMINVLKEITPRQMGPSPGPSPELTLVEDIPSVVRVSSYQAVRGSLNWAILDVLVRHGGRLDRETLDREVAKVYALGDNPERAKQKIGDSISTLRGRDVILRPVPFKRGDKLMVGLAPGYALPRAEAS